MIDQKILLFKQTKKQIKFLLIRRRTTFTSQIKDMLLKIHKYVLALFLCFVMTRKI